MIYSAIRGYYTIFFALGLTVVCLRLSMSRNTERIPLPSSGIGTNEFLTIHRYGPPESEEGKKIYIQATLHADEIPGLLVTHHLIKLLDEASRANRICINFNRDWPDLTSRISSAVKDKLIPGNGMENVKVIRKAMKDEIKRDHSHAVEKTMKRILYELACDADVVLDLHCDTDAVMHMYTHDRLWPKLSDLAAEIGSECHLLAASSGGNPFDEVMSCPWAALQDEFPDCDIPMACESTTIELRGELDVSDTHASNDARALYRFLQRRGFIKEDGGLPPLPALIRPASPLDGVDMIEATKAGVVVWKVKVGDIVQADQLLGEIVDIVDPDAARVPIVSKTSGFIFGMRHSNVVRPGQVIIKVAGESSLHWRQGHLLTAK